MVGDRLRVVQCELSEVGAVGTPGGEDGGVKVK